MEFHRIESSRDMFFTDAFDLYVNSFPNHERRTLSKQIALLSNLRYHFDVITEGGSFVGILLHWEGTGYAYIEHFAVRPLMRRKGTGGAILKAFCTERPLTILEIDPPVDDVAMRRESFYLRNGFMCNTHPHHHPPYQARFQPHELLVMSCPEKITEQQYIVFRKELDEVVMKDVLL